MPWCDPCDRFYNPNSVTSEGTCPTCGLALDASEVASAAAVRESTADKRPTVAAVGVDRTTRVPWHFWLMVGALALYLGWRLIQGIVLFVT